MTYLDVGTPSTDPGPDKSRRKDKTPTTTRLNRYWKEIEAYNKATQAWREQGEKIVKLYLDNHRTNASPRRFAMLWSNVETMKPAVYAKLPNVLCSRRYKDPAPVGRVAAELLERATNTTFDLYNVDEVFRMVRDDRLLVGRGQVWVRYEAAFDYDDGDDGQEYGRVAGEQVCVDYVGWQDFGHNVCGVWNDVWLVWRIVNKTYAEIEERFGVKIAEKLTFGAQVDSDGQEGAGEHTARIYELWDKKKKQTVWMAKECPDFLEPPDKPPLDFRNFFPCPQPALGTRTGKSLIPTPDYRYYQDQANEIDDLTDKISNITEMLQLRGFVPAGPSSEGADAARIAIQLMQSDLVNNRTVFIPVESWAGFTERGGASKIIEWLPIDIVIKALQGMVETRAQLIQDVYQITGISDILRGQTDPSETLGAQEIKAQTGSRRVKNCRDEIARICKDTGQLVAEVIGEMFQPQTLADITGYQYTPGMGPVSDPAQAQQGVLPPQMPAGPSPLLPPPQASPGPMQPAASQQQPLGPGVSSGSMSSGPPMDAPVASGAAMNGQGGPPMLGPQPPGMGPPGPMMNGGGPPMPPGGMPPPPPSAPPELVFNDSVVSLLRDDRKRGFTIDIETDSTIQPDEDAEKQRRVEYITAVGGFLQQAAPLVQQMPVMAPMISEYMLFLARGFRAGRGLEDATERTMQQVQAQLTQMQANPPPDPKVEAEKAKMEMEGQRAQAEMQMEQQKLQAEMQMMQAKHQMDQQAQQMDLLAKQKELEFKERELELKAQELEMKAQFEREKSEREAAAHAEDIQMQRDDAEISRANQREQMDFDQGMARDKFDFEKQQKNTFGAAP